MAVAQVVDARVNPIDSSQRVALWGNGRIEVRNTAPVTDGPQYYDRPDQPVVTAIWVIEWGETTAGYVLDKQGGFHPFGGAPAVGENATDGDHQVVNGVPYWYEGIYLDWSWDPNTPGRGVVLDGYGTLHPFGGAPTPPRPLNRWTNPTVGCRFEMTWGASPRAYTLDRFGGIHADYAAVSIPASAGAPYWPGWHAARHLAITNWSTGAGYTLNLFGGVHPWGGAEPAFGGPYNPSGDWARVLKVLNPDDPLRLWQVWAGGQEFEWTASTPPTVTAGGVALVSPASTVTDTTRPMLAWDYSDPQRDSQAAWELYVFTAAFVASHTMTDPSAHAASALVAESGNNPNTRGVVTPVDLDNGSYRMYVRAQDTAGQWSAWSNRAWTQAITLPATPTGLTATPVVTSTDVTVALSVTATPSATAKLVRFDFSDDAGATWAAVDGAEAVPIATTTTAVDRFPPQGKDRDYQATAYSDAPRIASLPSTSATAATPVIGHLLHAVDNPTLGGVLTVQGMQETRTSSGGTFQGLDADYPTAVKDGSAPRAIRLTMDLLTTDAAAWDVVEKLALSRSTLVLRRPFGDVRYVEILGDWSPQQVRAAPLRSEATPLRHMHTTGLPLVEVAPPHLAA